MTVSILVPVFQVEQWIERCARSLFEQTYSDLEYVFVDDCTTDRSIELLLLVADEYPIRKDQIVLIHNKENKGTTHCRDIGIENAHGEFISIVDADDWLEQDAIEQLVKEQERTGADLVWGKAMMHTSTGDVVLNEPSYANKHELLLCYSRLTANLVMTNWKRIIRRSLFFEHDIKAKRGTNFGGDKLLMTQVAYYAKSFSVIDKLVYHYNRVNEFSMTAKARKGSFVIDIFKKEMWNILAIENFWRTKEHIYYQEMISAKLRFLIQRLSDTILYSSPEGFDYVMHYILAVDKNYFYKIGINPLNFKVKFCNYYVAKLYWKIHFYNYRISQLFK